MARWRSEEPAPPPPEMPVRERVKAVDLALVDSDLPTWPLGYVIREGVRYPVARPAEAES